MSEHANRRAGEDPRVPRAFAIYTILLALPAAAVLSAVSLSSGGWPGQLDISFALLAAFVLIGELLPVPVPRRDGYDRVAVSSAFAFALLLSYGLAAAITVYALTSIIGDVARRAAIEKVTFNAAQYTLSLAAAGAALHLTAGGLPVGPVAEELAAVAAGGAVFFVVNNALAGAGAAILVRQPVLPYLMEDLGFQTITGGFLMALGPVVVVTAEASPWLIPAGFVPMLAIYIGGRQAVENAHRASHDLLTELPNRWLLQERLVNAVGLSAGRGGTGILMVDLDDFKAVNDTLGHFWGDALLEQVALRLVKAVRPEDTVSRLGGDEFAVLVPGGTDPQEYLAVADRLLAALERPFDLDGVRLDVRASVGIACHPQHGESAPELLQRADIALYAAKEDRSRCQLYSADRDGYSIDRLMLATQLKRGISAGELELHYQPKHSLDGRGPAAAEALVRWRHPELGLLMPDAFIALAEQSELVSPLTEWVLDEALAQCVRWDREGLRVCVGVNICTRSLIGHELPLLVQSMLERHAVPASRLQLEITESRMIAEVAGARARLDELRSLGVSIALDDFGTGFSSLAQLEQLAVDEIKIDKSFILRMDGDVRKAAMVRSIIELGRNLDLAVTAEGVETESAAAVLLGAGCHYAQGYLYGRPVPAPECARVLRGYTVPADASVLLEVV